MKSKQVTAVCVFALLLSVLCGCSQKGNYVEAEADIADSFPIRAEKAGENPQLIKSDGPYAVLHTTAGDITILLYPKQAPKAVENFITLAKEGYYDGTLFHYAKRGELTQTGKPGKEEEEERSIYDGLFADEFHDGLHHFPGAVSMAGAGMNQNLSQFYLLVQNTLPEKEEVLLANFYMNELMRSKADELNERNRRESLSEEDIKTFETDLNEKIQAIGTDGVPDAYREKYRPVVEQYQNMGGAWSLDYKYTVFGQITDGLNVAEAITNVKVEASTRQPKKDVVIESIEILE